MPIKIKLVKVKVKPRKGGKKGPFYLNAFGRTYPLKPNQIVELPERVVSEFGQYFEKLPEVIVKEEKVKELKAKVVEAQADLEKMNKDVVVYKKDGKSIYTTDTTGLTKDEAVDKVEKLKKKLSTKDKPLTTYLEMKSAVSALGINTHGMKKADLEKILKEK